MKKSLVILAAMVMVIAMVGGAYAAQQTNSVTTSATISAKCSFSAATSTIPFGTIDPSDTGNKTATTTGLTYACTNGSAAPTLTTGMGAQTLVGLTPANTIAYALSNSALVAGTGFGAAEWKSIVFTATILEADYQAAAADTYSDVVVVTFSY